MAKGNFLRCHEVTAKWEGGWSNHPADPGGKTMYGITQAVFDDWCKRHGRAKTSVRYISRADALAIYQSNYWNAAKCESLDAGVDLAVYDASVNSGVSRGRKWLLASVGGSAAETVKRICAKRLGFVQSLAIWKTFGRGWARRIADIEAKGVAWALSAQTSTSVAKMTLEREQAAAAGSAKRQAGSAVATGGSGVVATQAPDNADQMAATSLTIFIVLAALVAGFLIWRAYVNRQRAAAYAVEAEKV